MKTRLLSLFIFLSVNSFSQITVYENDLVGVGDLMIKAFDPNANVSLGTTGPNQYWDFGSLQFPSFDNLFFVDPSLTSSGSLYNNVNLAMEQGTSVSYFNKGSSGMYIHGINDTVFATPALYYPLPLTYPLIISDGPSLVIDNVITGALLNIALPAATVASLTNGLANSADTAVVKILNTSNFEVDASGTMNTPLGTFDVLRLKSIKYTDSQLDIYCSDTLTGLGTWITNVPFSSIPFLGNSNNNMVEYKYEWITNDPSAHFLIAEVIVDSLDNIMDGVSFQINSSVSSIYNNSEKRNLIKLTDLSGKETKRQNNKLLFYEYDNGIIEKKIIVE